MPDNSSSTFQSQLVPFKPGASLPVEITCTGKFENQRININFTLAGHLENISLDAIEENPRRTDNLWQKTCFELFVKSDQSTQYWEYNLSPSLNWAIYAFEKYREGKTDELSISDLPIIIKIEPDQFSLESVIPLPTPLFGHNLNIGVSCVVQDKNGDIYYYALTHTREQADFHDENCFIIKL